MLQKMERQKLNPTIRKNTDLRNYEKKVETVYSLVGLTPVFSHSRLGNLGSLAQKSLCWEIYHVTVICCKRA